MGRSAFLTGIVLAGLILAGCRAGQTVQQAGEPVGMLGQIMHEQDPASADGGSGSAYGPGSGTEPGEPAGNGNNKELAAGDPKNLPAEETDASIDEPADEVDPTLFPKKHNLPDGFVYVDDHIPGILLDIRYFGEDNFVGARVDGYKGPFAILSREAADALAKVQADVTSQGLTLLIYDAYRPQKAVDHFKAWLQNPDDTKTKADYYPDLDKSRLFKLGYIASKSGHSRGSTVDLTLADAATGIPLDMGTHHDFLGEKSHHGSPLVTEEQAANRLLLRETMEKHGFKAYEKEWWHYTLADEPYPDTYFDFDVE
jgi:D-alanyl-D-alanine dipeptidase